MMLIIILDRAMNRLKKSQSNPPRVIAYSPAQKNTTPLGSKTNRAYFIKSSSSKKLNKSQSTSSTKFGIRQLPASPAEKNSKRHTGEKSSSKITINTLNMNLVIQEKASKLVSPLNMYTQRSKAPKDIYMTKMNFFKSTHINRMGRKEEELNQSRRPKKQVKKTVPFNFQPIKKLSNGQYGGLYLALEKQTHFLAVLKAFNKQKITLDFMIDEFKIQLFCQHPNILPAYGFFFGRSEVYLIMEAGSHNLYTQIKKAGHFSEKKAANYIRQVMKGIGYLHLNGVIHRDIKPENIIISGGVLKICDFGWSAITYSERKTFCGTLDYLSPEVANGEKYDVKIDSWSVGVLLFEMLTGLPPYEAIRGTCDKKPALDYRKQIIYPSRISSQCKNLIQKLLNVDPELRPSIAEALRDPWMGLANLDAIKNGVKNIGKELF